MPAESSPRRVVTLSPRRHSITITTAFTANAAEPTGRIFNSRFSNRFKKS